MSDTQTIEIDGLIVGKSMVKNYRAEIDFLRAREKQLQARILTMATIENNLRGGLKQLDRANRQLRRNYNQSLKNSNEMLAEQNGIIDRVRNLVIEESHQSYQTITSMVLSELDAPTNEAKS